MIIVLYSTNPLVLVMEVNSYITSITSDLVEIVSFVQYQLKNTTESTAIFISKTQGKLIDLECLCIVQVKFVI